MHRSQKSHLRLAGRAADCHPGPAEPRRRSIPSVVDPQCRVIGATRLRVIDASIMPTVVQAKVTVPALYVAGDRDLVVKFPGAQQTLANAAPQLRKHIVLPVCGHWTQQERATDVNAAMVEFLSPFERLVSGA